MAKSLVEALSEDFDPNQYVDEYRLAVEKIIESKAAGKTPVFADEPVKKATVIDLAAALEASLRDAKEARAKHPSATSLTAAKAKKATAARKADRPAKRPAAKKPAGKAATAAKAQATKAPARARRSA